MIGRSRTTRGNPAPGPERPRGRAVKSLSARRSAALLGAFTALAAYGCTASGDEVRPPERDFYFPTGIAMSPGGEALGVVSANSDLRYDSGTLAAVDVGEVRALVDEWLGSGEVPPDRDCRRADDPPHAMECSAVEVVPAGASVRIGNFASDVAFQELSSGMARAFVPVRGDPSITYVDFDPETFTLDCGGAGEFSTCGEDHRLQRLQDDGDSDPLPPEPFGIYVDGDGEYVVATHLEGAGLSLVDAPQSGEPPVLTDVLLGVFQTDGRGLQSTVGVAARTPGARNGDIYVTSRSEATLRSLHIVDAGGRSELTIGRTFDLQRLAAPSNEARGIAFSEDGGRAYVVNRAPPSLQMIDTAPDARGRPANEPIGSVGLCREGSKVRVADVGRGERAYVACFASGDVWAIDTARRAVDAVIPVGSGPDGLAVSREESLLFVSNFLDDSVTVVDLEEGSNTEHRAVLRLGLGARRNSE